MLVRLQQDSDVPCVFFQTTILYKLKLGEVVTTIPTIGKKFPSDLPAENR